MSKKLLIMNVLSFIPDSIFNKFFFLYKNKYWPNLKNPKSFNEKINYIKLYSKYPLRTLAADRIKVRDYIQKRAPECKLISVLWNGWEFTNDIYENMPQKFVIKANHGSGMVLIVNKDNTTFHAVKNKVQKWLSIDYGKVSRQSFYSNVDKVLIVEEFLDIGLETIPDYKFMCLNGKIKLVQVDLDRFMGHKRNIYDENFERIDIRYEFPQGEDIEKPKLYNEAVKIAEKLSVDFDLIRVDLYITDEEIYFGELTNTPDNGFGRFYPKEFDFELGKKLIFVREFDDE